MVFKKPAPPGRKLTQVPQTTGTSGWIILSYESGNPVCVWMNARECKTLPCIIDERICGDTILRVERLSQFEFAVADIWMYNSNCVYAASNYEQRMSWFAQLLAKAHTPTPHSVHLRPKSELDPKIPIRGYEVFTDEINSHGYFVEQTESKYMTVQRTDIPDVYRIEGGYLRVPDLNTSIFLRNQGPTFRLECAPYDEESWVITENIPEQVVNAP